MNLLIRDIQLLSNHKSFLLGVGNTRSDLWLLLHFKHLEIKDYKICYQRNNGMHQRKSTVYPKRWLKKRFNTTAELLGYLYSKFYDIFWNFLWTHFSKTSSMVQYCVVLPCMFFPHYFPKGNLRENNNGNRKRTLQEKKRIS